jgi:ABC-type polysaccharide transport system permease subunit
MHQYKELGYNFIIHQATVKKIKENLTNSNNSNKMHNNNMI